MLFLGLEIDIIFYSNGILIEPFVSIYAIAAKHSLSIRGDPDVHDAW